MLYSPLDKLRTTELNSPPTNLSIVHTRLFTMYTNSSTSPPLALFKFYPQTVNQFKTVQWWILKYATNYGIHSPPRCQCKVNSGVAVSQNL